MIAKKITYALLAATLLPLAAAGQPACDSEEHHQFDFWVGDWTVVTAGTDQVAGSNRIERILGGCALQENWVGATGSEGKSFNMYYAADGTWRQTWVDNSGNRLDLSGGLDADGRMVLRGETPIEGGATLHEIAWTPNKDGTVLQHWRASQDGGETWRDLFLGTYKRTE